MHLSCGVQIESLNINKTSISIVSKYTDFADVFSNKLATKLSKYIGINDYVITLIKRYQPPYGLIYSLGLVKFEILKTYIETNLANGYIKPSKALLSTHILFEKNFDGSLQLCIDYRVLNNLMI